MGHSHIYDIRTEGRREGDENADKGGSVMA